ncbi:hypothetical protein SPPR111872_15475 [Sphingobacterium prati]
MATNDNLSPANYNSFIFLQVLKLDLWQWKKGQLVKIPTIKVKKHIEKIYLGIMMKHNNIWYQVNLALWYK